MRLTAIKPGDHVKVDDGLPYFAEVIELDAGQLRVSPITGPRGVRSVRARQVIEHWRKAQRRSEP